MAEEYIHLVESQESPAPDASGAGPDVAAAVAAATEPATQGPDVAAAVAVASAGDAAAAEADNAANEGAGASDDADSDEDVWSGFASDEPALVEAPDEVVQFLANELGVEPTAGFAAVMENIRAIKARPAEPEFANEYIAEMNKVAADGGDWRSVIDARSQLATAKHYATEWDKVTPEEWFKWQLGEQAKQLGDDVDQFVARNLEGFSAQVIEARGKAIKQEKMAAQQKYITDLEGNINGAADRAKAVRAAVVSELDKTLPAFVDPDTARPIPLRQQAEVRRILTDAPAGKEIPKALYDLIFPVENGKIDFAKSVERVYNLIAAKDKVQHLTKVARSKARKGEFAKITGAAGSDPKGSDGKSVASKEQGIHGKMQEQILANRK
jgi:hypothetical protein